MIETHWIEQKRMYEKIKAAGGFEAYAGTLPNLADAFQSDKCLRCIDEGTKDGLHAAGSGIAYIKTKGFDKGLKGYQAIDAGLTAAADAFKNANLDGIYSHEECGAAKLIYDKFPDSFKEQLEKEHKIKNSDEFGAYFANRLATKIGTEYKGMIKIADMARPSGHHVARFTYIDSTGTFNPSVEGLPKGFVISRRYLEGEEMIFEADVSISIVLGSHGFGDRITAQQPHALIVIGNDGLSKEALIGELVPLVAKYNGRVIVDGCTAPFNK